ncbi:MAG TPA: hypothetical protein VKA46_17970 [Gemmataceae bacterium]|nr:hypothetical protein [Gemmataceae bacterium]
MLTYDMASLFQHPLKFRARIPSAIVTFGGRPVGQCRIQVQRRKGAQDVENQDELLLSWDVATLKSWCTDVEEEIAILLQRDEDRATRTELAAVVVAVAVMAHIEPQTLFTRRSSTGTRHDYYLNETRDEMIEIAGRWEAGLPGLFEEKRDQSNLNRQLRKRWVSVTIVLQSPRNRTERRHP